MITAGVANQNFYYFHFMSAERWALVNSMRVIETTTHFITFNDSNAHEGNERLIDDIHEFVLYHSLGTE